MEHCVSYKVYYEDTDCLGVVYHANYLKYLERGRTEFVGTLGKPISEWNHNGYYFVVYAMNIKFKRAAFLNDSLDVITTFQLNSPFRGLFRQRIERANELVIEADVEIVCLDPGRAIREFPEPFHALGNPLRRLDELGGTG